MKKVFLLICIILLSMGCQNQLEEMESITPVENQNMVVINPITPVNDFKIIEVKAPIIADYAVIGNLTVSRVLITPDADPTSSIRLSFTLDQLSEQVEILVYDKNDRLHNIYRPEKISYEHFDSKAVYYRYKTLMHHLLPDQDYTYLIHLGQAYSPKYVFKTLGYDHQTMAFFGDIQGYKLSQYEAFENTYKLALDMTGPIDINYLAGDVVDNGDLYAQWLYFDNAMSDYLSSSIWMSTVGNHDVYYSDTFYKHTFNYPRNGVSTLDQRTYYIDLPFARIAVWDTESPELFEQQSNWLKDIMTDVSKFKIVLMHRSAYPMRYNEIFIRNLHNTFDASGINLVLSGHDHIFHRTTMKNDKNVQVGEGVTYIVGGSPSGSKYYEEDTNINRYWRTFVYDDNNPVWTMIDIGKNELLTHTYGIVEGDVRLIDETYQSR